MKLHELDHRRLRELLIGTDPLLVIAAPNFEQRSRGVVERILATRVRLSDDGFQVRPIEWLLVTFQGAGGANFLDGVKGNMARETQTDILSESKSDHVEFCLIPYPLDEQSLILYLRGGLHGLTVPEVVIIDFSAIPRNILFKLVVAMSRDALVPHIHGDDQVYLTYCWATHYPQMGNLELVGETRGQLSRQPLSSFVEGSDYCEVTVLNAGAVHDAYAALTSVEPITLTGDTSITTVYFVHNFNLRESWRQLHNHHGLLRQAGAGWQVEYAFTVNHVLDIVERSAECALIEARKGRRAVFAAANFGPKPVVVGTQMIVENIMYQASRENLKLDADLFNSMGTQYLSVYSLGVGHVSVFRLAGVKEQLA